MSAAGTIVYSCPFVPAEWISAHGFAPKRLVPNSSAPNAPIGNLAEICPYARAFGNLAATSTDASAIILTTACDQMRRTADLVEAQSDTPVFLFHVPHTWMNAGAVRLYRDELMRLARFLLHAGGAEPTREALIDVILSYDERRKELRTAVGTMPSRQWAEALAAFHAGTPRPPHDSKLHDGVPIALLGGPVLADHREVYDLIEEAGGRVAWDGTETGERGLAAPINRTLLREDPVSALIDAYFGSIPDPFRRPNSLLFRDVGKQVADRGIKGVVLHRYLWCDLWHAEARRLKEWLKVPLVEIDAAEEGYRGSRIRTMLSAFMEEAGE